MQRTVIEKFLTSALQQSCYKKSYNILLKLNIKFEVSTLVIHQPLILRMFLSYMTSASVRARERES